jgi:hypothetical protein
LRKLAGSLIFFSNTENWHLKNIYDILFKCKIGGFYDFEHSQKPRTGGDNKIKEPVLCTCGPE